MGDVRGFLKVKRRNSEYRPVCERIKDYGEVCIPCTQEYSREQASRCMDCGTPFCHFGCPLGNYIPEWNDLLFNQQWERAFELLDATNILPEVTGRVCPSLCEYACVLDINDDPVTIRENELAIIEYAFRNGLVKPRPPKIHTGKKVAVVGSGPAGLACAVNLNRAGHEVVVFERDDKIGGIMRYGIPDFKLEKNILDRRMDIWKKEGIEFRVNTNVGVDYPAEKLLKEFDVVCLTGGSRVPRDLKIEGRELKGIHFAMDYLSQSNRRIAGEKIQKDALIDAKGKKVVVVGGGDTGADCVGVANRQGAKCVVQIEVLPEPPVRRGKECPWPRYPLLLKTTTSHEEGVERRFSVLTKEFIGDGGQVKKLSCVRVSFSKDEKGSFVMKELPKKGFEIAADIVIIAIGFLNPEHHGLLKELGIKLDNRGNVKTGDDYMTSVKGVFSAGDMRRGQSLIVWALSEGSWAAAAIDTYLEGKK